MSTFSTNGVDWNPASIEQISYMEQARAFFDTSRFVFDNGQIQIVPTLTKNTYVILYPDDTYSYLHYGTHSKKNKLDFIRERVKADELQPISEEEAMASDASEADIEPIALETELKEF